MKHVRLIIAACLCAFVLGAASAQTQEFRYFLASITNGQAMGDTICDGSAPIHDGDTGSLSATQDADGRYIVAYQDRQAGSKSFIMQHVGAELVDFGAPVLADTQAVPRLSPDGPKQGSLALVPSAVPGGKSRLYYTQREQDDTPNEGPYGIWCMEF